MGHFNYGSLAAMSACHDITVGYGTNRWDMFASCCCGPGLNGCPQYRLPFASTNISLVGPGVFTKPSTLSLVPCPQLMPSEFASPFICHHQCRHKLRQRLRPHVNCHYPILRQLHHPLNHRVLRQDRLLHYFIIFCTTGYCVSTRVSSYLIIPSVATNCIDTCQPGKSTRASSSCYCIGPSCAIAVSSSRIRFCLYCNLRESQMQCYYIQML